MKHVKIVVALTFTVVAFTLAVFFVEGFTTPYIEAELRRIANEAKFDVLPGLDAEADKDGIENYFAAECSEEEADVCTVDESLAALANVKKLYVIPNKGYIYEVMVRGFGSDISYLVGLDMDGNVTGFNVVSQNETAGLGDQILNEAFLSDFRGLSAADAEAGNIKLDGLGGATPWITIGALKTSLNEVMVYHKVTFKGAVVETPEEKLLRLKREISVLDATLTDVSADYTLPAEITKVEYANDGSSDVAVIFTVEYVTQTTMWEPGTTEYIVSFDLATGDLLGVRILEAGDSAGIGAEIKNELFWSQFTNMTQADAADGNYFDVKTIDATATGSFPITLGSFKASMTAAVDFYKAEIAGEAVETPEQRLARWYQEISATGATFTDVSADYTLPTGISKVEVANDGSNDIAMILHVEYTTDTSIWSPAATKYMVSIDLETGDLLGLRVLEAGDTTGIGAEINKEIFWMQFDNMTQADAENGNIYDNKTLDGTAGATFPITLGAFKVSLADAITFYKVEVAGEAVETEEQKLARWYEELSAVGATFSDVTSNYDNVSGVKKVELATVGAEDVAVILTMEYTTDTSIWTPERTRYLVSFDLATGDVIGVRVLEAGDSVGIGAEIAKDDFVVQFNNMLQADAENGNFDAQAGASFPITLNAFKASMVDAVDFYNLQVAEQEWVRPNPEAVSDALLLQGYSTASTFTSVYLDYAYDENIINMYEAFNGSGESIGFVYVYRFAGNSGNVIFVLGVDNDNNTVELSVLIENETWHNNTENYDSATWGTDFKVTPWLDQFDGIPVSDLIFNQVDAIAGVSTTTSRMIDALENITIYHIDQIVLGGAE